MQSGYRFRCYPAPRQEQTLRDWIGCQRYIYNAKVREDRYFRRFSRKALTLAGQRPPVDQRYSQFKSRELSPWLFEVPSVVLRNGAVRWKQAYARFFKRLAGRPTIHRNRGPQSVWLTSELFALEPATKPDAKGSVEYCLTLGTRKFPIGELAFKAHRAHPVPASIVLTLDCGHWYLSFSADDGMPESKPEEIAAELAQLSEAALLAATVGIDRGVVIPACASTGQHFDFRPIEQHRMQKKARAKRRWQRRMARRTKGSSGWRKAKRRIARCHQYARNVRRDFAHQTSQRLVANDGARLIAFEDLRVRDMTRKPKAKQDERGRWQRNGARAKAGLNTSILVSAWGQTRTYTKYKALRLRKLCVEVPAAYTSQECSRCGHTHPENRPTQALFLCQRCGFTCNADENAARVIAKRAAEMVRAGRYQPKPVKRTMRLKQQVGAERSEPSGMTTPREIAVSREAGNCSALWSLNLETPSTSQRL